MTKGVWRTDCRAPYGGLACRLGRCFCLRQRCPPDTRTAMTGRQLIAHFIMVAMTKRFVILSANRERIRNSFKRETDCRAPFGARNDEGGERTDCRTSYGGLACRLGRCFCLRQRCLPDTRTAMTAFSCVRHCKTKINA